MVDDELVVGVQLDYIEKVIQHTLDPGLRQIDPLDFRSVVEHVCAGRELYFLTQASTAKAYCSPAVSNPPVGPW